MVRSSKCRADGADFILKELLAGDYIRRMMAKVEGMPLAALEHGIEWNWSTFAEYLARLDGRVGVNAAFLVGHCALRRSVMGKHAVGNQATPAQIEAMVRLLHESISAGGIGFSSSQAFTHQDGDGSAVPSRSASPHCSTISKAAFTGRNAALMRWHGRALVSILTDEEVEREE